MIRRRTITSYVWNSVSGNKMVILLNCIRNFFRKFELIGNSVQGENPAPDNPQEIESVGRKSKNLLIENIYVFTVQDNIAYIPLPEGHETKLYTMLIQKKPGENDDVGFTCGFYDKSNMTATYSAPCLQAGNLVTGNGIVNSKIGVNHFVCFSPADSRFFDIYNVMYAEGKETTLDYEPYGYLLDVKVTGKNLFNAEKARDTANWIIRDGDGYAKFPIRVGKGNEATFSYTEKLTPGKGFYIGIAQSDTGSVVGWLYHSTEINLNNNKFTVVAKGDCLYLSCNKTSIQKFFDTIQTLQVEMGSEPTPYEPYTGQSVQIALDEPLRGIGEYKDTITKDGVVRKILEAPIAEYLQNAIYGNPGEKYISSAVPKCYINYDKNKCMSNIGFASNAENKKYIPIPRLESFLIKVSDDDTVETIKEKMKDVIVTYTIKEPTTEPLPESVQAQLQALHTENGITHVFVDSGEVEAGINIEYKYKS